MFREGRWLLRVTATGMLSEVQFGQAGDTPMSADFDADGQDDLLLWRQFEGAAYVLASTLQDVQRATWGRLQPGDALVLGDYDGDQRAEPACWRAAKAAWEMLFNPARR